MNRISMCTVVIGVCLLSAGLHVDGQVSNATSPSGDSASTIISTSTLAAGSTTSSSAAGSTTSSSAATTTSIGAPAPAPTTTLMIYTSTGAATTLSSIVSMMPSSTSISSSTTAKLVATTVIGPYTQSILPGTNVTMPITVAVICCCLCFASLVVLFTAIAFILQKHRASEEELAARSENKKRAVAGAGHDAAFYEGLNPQSNQLLVTSMSNQSFQMSPSDVALSGKGGNVYYNRGFEVDQGVTAVGGGVKYETETFRPIEIKSSKA